MTPTYPDGRPKRRIDPKRYMWCLTVQGEVITVSAHQLDYEPQHSTKGRRVTGFSQASRMRLIKLISRIDWTTIKTGLFVTVTCPDESWPMCVHKRTQNRHRLFRDMEKDLSGQFPAIWRIEWKARLSGKWRGRVLPHWHIVIPGIPFFHKDRLNQIWRSILSREESLPLATRVDSLTSDHHQQVYICKYAAKLSGINGLDSPLQLNTGGRHWGIHRKNLLPMHEEKHYNDLNPGIVARLRRVATQTLHSYDPLYDAGFTLHGEAARKNMEAIHEIILDSGTPTE